MKHTGWIGLCFLLNTAPVFSNTDSLYAVWKNESLPDSSRFKAFHDFTWKGFLFTNPDTAFQLAEEQLAYAVKKKNVVYQADAYNTQGICFYFKGEFDSAIVYYEKGIALNERTGNFKAMAPSLMNLGSIYMLKGDYGTAIEKMTLSLKIEEFRQNKIGMANCLNNIGNIHMAQENADLAWDYFSRAAAIYEEIGNKTNVASAYNNMGIIAASRGDMAGAEKYHALSLDLRRQNNDQAGIAGSLNNIGLLYRDNGEYQKSLPYFLEAVALLEVLGDVRNVAACKNNVAIAYMNLGRYDEAIALSTKSLQVATEMGAMVEMKDAAETLYLAYKRKANYQKSLEMYTLYVATRDSIESKANQDEIARQEYKYAYEKKAIADSLKRIEEEKVGEAELLAERAENEKREQRSWFLMAGLVVAVIFGFFIYTRLRLTNKQKAIIEEQRIKVLEAFEQLEEKNKEVLDSITYAKRIQSAILPSPELVSETLGNAFVLYEPKDIVAGDFYWIESVARPGKEPLILFAAADCTGHGVPGALVSVVCHNALNRAVREFQLTDPGAILDKTRELVIHEFEKSRQGGAADVIKDGMDIALCALDQGTIRYAGANNPLWIIRNKELLTFKPDKQPIGQFDGALPFSTHEYQLQSGDLVYVFTDGYTDQFGGDKGKKFKASNFKELLLSVLHLNIPEQKTRIKTAFEDWRGSLEQVDDVCVIGLKI